MFDRDAILNIKHVTNWEHIKQSNQKRIKNNSGQENKSRVEHHYQVGDQVLINAIKQTEHDAEYEGLYFLTKFNSNSTVNFQKEKVNDTIDICRIKPFFS